MPERAEGLTRAPLKWYLICASYKLGNENIIPFIFSIGILALTYQLGYMMSGKQNVGIIALLVVLASTSFTKWDTSATYDQTWSFFLLLACCLVYVKPRLAIISYVISILSKTLGLMYLPMFLYHIWQQHKKPEYIMLYVTVITVLLVLTVFLLPVKQVMGGSFVFSIDRLYEGSWKWIFYFADDLHIMIGTPVMLSMLFIMRSKIKNASIIFVWCVGIILSVPVIMGFTDQIVHPYRFVPYTVFFGIGVGMIVNHLAQKITSKILVSKHGLRTVKNNP